MIKVFQQEMIKAYDKYKGDMVILTFPLKNTSYIVSTIKKYRKHGDLRTVAEI